MARDTAASGGTPMQMTRLRIQSLRNLQAVELNPGPGLNLLTGANGAGKTSVLEAIHLLAYGRSFRGRVRDGLIRTGAEALEVFIEWTEPPGNTHRVGLRHRGLTWTGRLDGAPVKRLGALCAAFAAITFEPGSHALVSGGTDMRRRYLDWGLFHVEPDFLSLWQDYHRALKQRNAVLKQGGGGEMLALWDRKLVAAGEPLTQCRAAYLERLQPLLEATATDLLPGLGAARFQFQSGWRRDQIPLRDALMLARARDQTTGFTSVGPHRADWRIEHQDKPARETLSRGQMKLIAMAALLAQAEDFAVLRGQWPVVLLDDLASELDAFHQSRVVGRLLACQAQVFVTGTHLPEALAETGQAVTRFHVEQGRVSPLS